MLLDERSSRVLTEGRGKLVLVLLNRMVTRFLGRQLCGDNVLLRRLLSDGNVLLRIRLLLMCNEYVVLRALLRESNVLVTALRCDGIMLLLILRSLLRNSDVVLLL